MGKTVLDTPPAGEDISVTRFRQYLRIETVQPNPDYVGAKSFLDAYAEELGFPIKHLETKPGKWVTVMTCEGTQPNLKSIILNSHIDVVPVFPEHWKHPPFSAHREENGDIYARGSQDMKLVGVQYMEALRRLRAKGWQPKRTYHLMWVPDEEIGGHDGMKTMLEEHPQFVDSLNAGFELDEGLATPGETYRVFYGERSPWWVKVTAKGQPGHASAFIEDTCSEQLAAFIAKVMEFRKQQKTLMDTTSGVVGDVTTVNWTICEGGVQANVIPEKMMATFDFRITPKQDMEEFGNMLESWRKECGPSIEFDIFNKNTFQGMTSLDDPHWRNMAQSFDQLGMKYQTEIFPAATDARYLREYGIPSIGFSPMIREEILLHDHNERLNEKTFLRGVEIYETVLKNLAEVQI